MSKQFPEISELLFGDIKNFINESRQLVANTANSAITVMYWNIGDRIQQEILNNERAQYGQQIITQLSKKLSAEYGRGWSEKQIRHCIRFAETYAQKEIVYALSRQLSWTHFRILMYLNNDLCRSFYQQMTQIEKWSTRALKEKIDSMLFERTAISKKPEDQIKQELKTLESENNLTPDLVFRDPYILDFLGLDQNFSEQSLENAILAELEKFILELGQGFTFVDRQKRMLIDGDSFRLDLLFYHRKLKRLIAIELKLGKFKAAYKGQMELYLRYLQKHDLEKGEQSPIGLILCAEGNSEQIELLQLDESEIRVAEYITELPPKELLKEKLHRVIETQRAVFNNKD